MAAKPKLTPEEWALVKHRWESDPRDGYVWLVDEMELPISSAAVRKTALKDGWSKARTKVSPKVFKVSEQGKKTMPETITKTLKTMPAENHEDVVELVEPGAKFGRPTDYKPDYAERGYKLTLLGLTDEEIAGVFDVATSTLYLWKQKYPEFSEALRRGKEEADAEVAASLYHRARGYSHPETHVAVFQGQVIQTELVKHYPPDTGAALLWLKNRQSKNWKDKVEVKQDVNLNVFPSKEALDSIYNRVLAEAAKRDAILVGRRERLGIVVDVEARDVD